MLSLSFLSSHGYPFSPLQKKNLIAHMTSTQTHKERSTRQANALRRLPVSEHAHNGGESCRLDDLRARTDTRTHEAAANGVTMRRV